MGTINWFLMLEKFMILGLLGKTIWQVCFFRGRGLDGGNDGQGLRWDFLEGGGNGNLSGW